jgi:hypothetical protein
MLPALITASVMHGDMARDVVVDRELEVSVGDKVELRVPRQDATTTYKLEGLPEDALAKADTDGILVKWHPVDADVGTHRIRVDVRQGDEGYVKTVRLVVNERGYQVFAPGAASSLFVPNDSGHLGAFVGGGLEVVLFNYAEQGSMFVPSHGRFYLDALVLGSSAPGIDPMFTGALGFDLTLERAPGRRFLLPFVGAQVGISFQKQVGTFGWAMPLVGVYPWASRSLRIAVLGGYLLPTTAAQDVRGVVVTALVDVAPW